MSAAELHYQSLSATCRQIKSGARSSEAVTRHMLARIAALEPQLHSFAQVLAEPALARARELDLRQQQGGVLGALHGVPIAIKDLLDLAGFVTASGTRVMAANVVHDTATLVQKMLQAGAVIIGKTQLTEGAFGTHHPDIAAPCNPYNTDLWPGVSSSGSGVAVAAGLAFAAIGSDTGGSIRFPSACCGLVGIKPTYGRVSRRGGFPLAQSLDHFGPMTRTVEDAARLLGVIAGHDAADSTSINTPAPNYAAALSTERPLRVGVDWAYATQGVDAGVVDNLRQVAAQLAALDVTVVEVTMPPEFSELVDTWGLTCGVECARTHAQMYAQQPQSYGPALASLIDLGLRTTSSEYEHAQHLRAVFSAKLQALFTEQAQPIHALLTPCMPVPPQLASVMEAGYDDSRHAPFIQFTAPFNYTGHPTLTLPTGLDGDGLPRSVQLVGAHLDEVRLIQLGYLLEQHLAGQAGPMPHPPL